MNLQDVGNHFFLGLQPSARLSDKDKRLLEAVSPAGVILFKSNFQHGVDYGAWLETQRQLISDVQNAANRDKIIIAVDHEGGRVCRTPPPITRFKSASQWGPKAQQVGQAMGKELASLGFNMSFAPVMDIHTNPENPVIGDRAFGSTPETVSAFGKEFMDGIQTQQVWACAKHFPGHGDTDVDSHYALPVVHRSLEELQDREMLPFKAAVEHGIRMIMTAHILFPQIDPDLPATLSQTITTGVLRNQMEYDGVITSDDIGMHAMDRFFDSPDAPRDFMEASNDMLMICAHFTDTERIIGLATGLKEALADAGFRKRVFDPSEERVQALLDETRMHDVAPLPADLFAAHAGIDGIHESATVEVM